MFHLPGFLARCQLAEDRNADHSLHRDLARRCGCDALAARETPRGGLRTALIAGSTLEHDVIALLRDRHPDRVAPHALDPLRPVAVTIVVKDVRLAIFLVLVLDLLTELRRAILVVDEAAVVVVEEDLLPSGEAFAIENQGEAVLLAWPVVKEFDCADLCMRHGEVVHDSLQSLVCGLGDLTGYCKELIRGNTSTDLVIFYHKHNKKSTTASLDAPINNGDRSAYQTFLTPLRCFC